MAQTEEEARRLAEELTNATNALSQFSGMLYGQSAEQLKATQADKDAKEAAALFAAKMDAASDAAKALANTFVNYQKEVYKGSSANKAAAASIEAFGDAVQAAGILLSLFLPGGALIKGIRVGLAMLAGDLVKSGKLIAEQTDEIYKAYQDMAKAGAAGAGGMQDVFDSLQKVGMGTEKFGAYIKLVNENASDLAMFGGSVNKGRKIFENTMSSLSKDQRVQMEQMGLDREAQSQAAMAYIKQQRLLTAGTKAQMDTSSTAVMKYVAETDALTRITGANREEQQKILDEAMAEDIFGSFLDNMRSQGEEGVKKAEQIQNAIIMQQKMYGTQSAKGLRDSLTGFLGTSSENQKFFMSYGEGGQQLVNTLRDVNGTNDDMYDAMKAQAKSGKELNESMAGITGMGVAGDVFVAYKERRLSEQNFNKDLGKLFAEAAKERADMLKDPTTKKAAEAENNVKETQLKQQKLVNLAMDGYIDISKKTSEANLFLAKAALAAAEALGAIGKGSKAPSRAEQTKATSRAAAANEVKSGRIGPEEAKAVLENGSERDIKDFGGREALEKIAGSAPAKPPAVPSRGRGSPARAAPPAAAPAAAPAGGGGAPAGGVGAPAAPAAAPAGGGGAPAGGVGAPADSSTTPPVAAANAGLEKYANDKSLGALAENITKFESGKAGYNAYNRGTIGNKMIGSDKPIDFSTMTIADYLKHGKLQSGDPNKIFAVGKYQIIPKTMEGLVNKLKLDPDKTYLDKTTQDLLFNEGLIKQSRPNVAAYLAGRSNDRDLAILDMAKEFASVGVPYPAGKATARGESYYAGIGGNKAHNPPEAVGAALDADRKNAVTAADGGMFSGPKSGYPATLHGDEAVIPLKGGAVPVVMPKEFVEGMSKYNSLTEMLTDKFAENNVSASAKQELEDTKSRAMASAGPGAEAMLAAFNQMGAELRAQGEANRSLFEAMLRGQSTSNDIQNKMLRYTQN